MDRQKEMAAKTLLTACETVVPCLEDWIRTTGFGEVNRRDKMALEKIRHAIQESKKAFGESQ